MNYLIKEIKLNNGARGLIIDFPGARTVYNEVAFNAGYWQVRDFERKQQIPHIYEHMASNVRDYGGKAAYELALAKNGAIRNAFTGNEFVRFFTLSAKFDYERVLALHCQILADSDLNEKVFTSEKSNITNELSARLNDASYLLALGLDNALGVAGMTSDKAISTLQNINLADIVEYRDKYITSSNMRFIVAGDFAGDYSKVVDNYSNIDIPTGEAIALPSWKLHDGGVLAIHRGDTKQCSARLSFAMPRVFTLKNIATMAIINRLLVCGAGSRIFGKAREKGLVYRLNQVVESTAGYTIWSFNFSYKDNNLDALLKLIADELCNLRDGRLSDDDLAVAKCSVVGGELMSYETPRSVSNALFRRYLRFGEIVDLDELLDMIRSVTVNDISDLVNDLIGSGNSALGLYGDVTDDRAEAAREAVLKRLAGE